MSEDQRPKRIQRKRTKGWKMPPNTVYVGRPSIWGNPYFLVRCIGSEEDKRLDRERAVNNFRGYLLANQAGAERFRLPVHTLRGKDLACWCPLDQQCHADVLLEIANS